MAGQFSRFNAIDQLLDVAGSERQAGDRLLTDETGGFGSPVILASGVVGTITAFSFPNLTLGGLTGQSAASVGTLISVRGAEKARNNGVFRVLVNNSATSNDVSNTNGYFPDAYSGGLIWEQYNGNVLAAITNVAAGIATLVGGGNFTANSVGNFVTISGATTSANNGTFLITEYVSATSIKYANSAAVTGEYGLATAKTGTTSVTVTPGVSPASAITGLTAGGFTNADIGTWVTFSGFADANDGTFVILSVQGPTAITVSNAAAIGEGPIATITWSQFAGLVWTEKLAYSLNDDLDFERSDRSYIKGVAYDQPVPSYTRPTLVGVNIPTNLANIAGKTLDAQAKSVNRGQFNIPVDPTFTTIYATSALKHSDAVNTTGVPCFDAAPWTSDYNTCFVEVTDAVTGNELEVLAGPRKGERIFGLSRAGSTSTSPDSVEIAWYSCPNGGNIATSSTAYTWEKGAATAKTGTTTVTVVPGTNGESALTGLTAGGFASPADVGTWLTVSGSVNPANDGTFLIVSVQSGTAVTVLNPAAVAEAASPTVTWTQYAKTQPTFVNVTYGFNQRLDQLDQNAFRFPLVSGLTGDADLRQDVIDLQSTGGWTDGTTDLSTYLTNLGTYFAFNGLPGGAGDTVVSALNILNSQIGNRTYTPSLPTPGALLTSGETITASLQALQAAVTAGSVTRYIMRRLTAAPANVAITLPGAATYTLDGTFNGQNLWVWWRGVLRDPGSVANGDDYAETSTTQITPYSRINIGDHINFLVVM